MVDFLDIWKIGMDYALKVYLWLHKIVYNEDFLVGMYFLSFGLKKFVTDDFMRFGNNFNNMLLVWFGKVGLDYASKVWFWLH